MSDKTTKPVVFLAFANDRDDTVGYLRNLPDEARRLREVLEPAERAGLCEVVVRSNSSAGDIFKVFQDPRYRNRVGIFHYGGHANGYELLLESPEGKAATADAGGLAAFFAQQQGLRLVFLNSCSTQQQTQELHDANVAVVISTSRSIDDKVATDFAVQFYQGLAGGVSLRNAYNEAFAALKTTKGGDLRALYFGDADKPEDHRYESGFPWNLYPREGSENADQWNLPEAVKDPLFGLPPLPEQDLPESPYRHLAWFRREDAEVFFGRGHQIRKLYGLLTAGTQPIILFYGQSGVGKSSLLDAGLMPRLEQSCEVRYLRRRAGGLLDTLQLAFLPESVDVPIETAWLAKEEQLNRPLIVFLDQVEEFYTQPITDLPDELDQLLRVVKATFGDPKCRPQGKLVLGFRKEWLAELEAKMVAYELPRAKVSLEPLDRNGIIEVVQGPTRSSRLRERYGLKVDDGLAEIIADDLLADRGSAISTTLQILLSKMWVNATETNSEPPRFSQDLYQDLKREGILLRDFLNQQIAAFRERYPEAVDSGLLLDIVALHTTALGTADQCTVEQLQQQYAHLDAKLPDLLQQCQDLYLLTVAASTQQVRTKTTRLAHDTLAPLVREQFEASDKPGQRARRILDNRAVDWQQDREGTPLDEADLKVVEQGVAGTRALSATEKRLVEASRDLRARLKRLRMILKSAGAVAVAIVAITAGVALWQWSEAEAAKVKTIKERDAKEVARNEAETAKGEALTQLGEANHNLGLALLERATEYAAEGKYTHAYVTAGRAISFEGCGGPIDQFPSLLRQDSEEFQKASTIARQCASSYYWPQKVLFNSHGQLWDLAVEPSGQRVAVEKPAGPEIHILQIDNARTVKKLEGYDSPVYQLRFSPDGKSLASGHKDGTVLIWNLDSGVSRPLFHASAAVIGLAFSADGTLLATGGFSGDSARVVRLGEPEKTLFHLTDSDTDVTSVAFAPVQPYVLAGKDNGRIDVYETSSGRLVKGVAGHSSWVWSIAFHTDGDRFASAGGDHRVMIWSLKKILSESAPQPEAVIAAHEDHVMRVAFSPDGRLLASSGQDGTARSWDASTFQPMATLDAHNHRVDGLAFSDATHLVTGDWTGTIRLWDLARNDADRPQLNAHTRPIGALTFHPEKALFASGGFDNRVVLWNAETWAPVFEHRHSTGSVVSLVFDHSASRLFAGGIKGRIVAINVSDGSQAFECEDAMASSIYGLGVSPDAKLLASTGADGSVRLWDASTGEKLRVLESRGKTEASVSFALSGDVLVASGSGGIFVWDTKSWRVIREIQVHKAGDCAGAVVSRDGKYVISTGGDRKICISDVRSGIAIATLDAGVGLHRPLAVTSDMTSVVVLGFDRNVRVWDVNTGRQTGIMPLGHGGVNALAIDRTNHRLAYPGINGVVRFMPIDQPSIPKLDESRFHFNGLEVIFEPRE